MNFKDADQGRNYLLIMQVGTVGLFFLLVFGVNALFHAETVDLSDLGVDDRSVPALVSSLYLPMIIYMN